MTEKDDKENITPPEDVCVCFHVPAHKLAKFVRLNKPRFSSQLSECYGAGTGCGWCIPFLEKIFEQISENPECVPDLGISRDEYLKRRKEYHKKINSSRMKDEREEG